MSQNNTDYPLKIKTQTSSYKYSAEDKKKLNLHQFIPKEFFTRNNNTRGLLIAHAMGQGKTRIAVAISEYFREVDPSRRINVLLPKSLEANFKDNITQYNNNNADDYKFISLNASNMFKQMRNSDKTKEELAYEKSLGLFADEARSNSLDNTMLIIDEAHNLFNAITNGSKNGIRLYDLIMKAKNLKLIFLTGTPIINHPFELVPCFNMLKGIVRESRDKTHKLFSESIEEFTNFFIDVDKKQIKNKKKLLTRIYGLVSYYGDLYFPSDVKKKGFPEKLKTIVQRVPMSDYQYTRYINARTYELEEEKGKKSFRKGDSRFSSSSGGMSTYRVKSRQISNYAIPEYALGPVRGQKSRQKFLDKIKHDDLINTDKYSRKMSAMLKVINSRRKQLGMIYSQFVSGEGLGIFALILEAHGWRKYNSGNDDNPYGIKEKKKSHMTYAILSGNVSPEERAETIKVINSTANKKAQLINLILISSAVAEGTDLKRVRYVAIMEYFWNQAKISQIETRAIRYLSHVDLDKKDQNVQVYVFLSDYPKSIKEKDKKELTTDVELYKKSIDGMRLINSFHTALAESSIDCSVHWKSLPKKVQDKVNCLLCVPDGKQLFHPNIKKHMLMTDNCKDHTEIKIKVKTIKHEGVEYYYKEHEGTYSLYMHDEMFNGFVPMRRDNPLYSLLMKKIYDGSLK